MGHLWTHKTFRGLGTLAGCAALTFVVAACSGSSSGSASTASHSSASSLEETNVTVGAQPVADAAALYIAQKDGYFRQVGLNVHIIPVAQSTKAIPDMLHGTVDIIGGANDVSFIQADAGGVSIKILADAAHCTADSFEVMTLPGSGITSAASLAGKTVGINVPNDVQAVTLNEVLEADGVNYKSVHYVQVPFPDVVEELKDHKIDAFSGIEPYISAAEEQLGAVPVLSQCTGPTAGFPMSGYFSTSAWAGKNPNTVKAFQTAIDKAQALIDGDSQALRQILPTYTTITSNMADVLNLDTYPTSVSPSAMQDVATLLETQRLLSTKFSVSSMMVP
ncbi:MAG TPA: ABC transporter substrate-binding protein [Trebonia sp.]|jgi:NitT/TauT family transport system substrate-binding protein|nr:ABC transporter substrate-binding protein [Trebonia sp.]